MEIEIGDWRKKGWAEEGRWICALIGKVGNAGTDRAGTGKCRNKSKPASNFYTRTHHFRGTKTPKTFRQKKKKNPLQWITTSTRSWLLQQSAIMYRRMCSFQRDLSTVAFEGVRREYSRLEQSAEEQFRSRCNFCRKFPIAGAADVLCHRGAPEYPLQLFLFNFTVRYIQ